MAILVVCDVRHECEPLIRWGMRIARARQQRVLIVDVSPLRGSTAACERVPFLLPDGQDAESVELGRIRTCVSGLRTGDEALVEAAAEDGGESAGGSEDTSTRLRIPTIWRCRGEDPIPALLALVREQDVELVLAGRRGGARAEDEALSTRLMREVGCELMLLRAGGESGSGCRRILVPVAGGPNARRAMQLAVRLAAGEGGVVTALYVQDPRADDAAALGRVHLDKVLRGIGGQDTATVVPRVALSRKVREEIGQQAEGHDLVIVGASDHLFIARVLFGTIGDKMLASEGGAAIAVMRRAVPWHARVVGLLERSLFSRVPQMTREGRVELAERLHEQSTFNADFIMLIMLSTAIAGLGLLLDSTAVVVGAMLVAPLMTPIVGAGLGLVQGNAFLVRLATRSIMLGFLLALGIGVGLGLLAPGDGMTTEMLARGSPNLLDLGVACFSGIAAAYAMSRPNLSAALPGVAIAAALVPPIATVGICLAYGEFVNARGAALLFATNVVTIILAAAVTLYAVGLRPARSKQWTPLWVRRTVLLLLMVVAMLIVPLSWVYLSGLRQEERRIEAVLERHRDLFPEVDIVELVCIDQGEQVWQMHVRTPHALSRDYARQMQDLIATEHGGPVTLEVLQQIVLRLERAALDSDGTAPGSAP